MNTYKVRGYYTISFEMEVEANNREEAEEMGYNANIQTEWNGNSVFFNDGTVEADGEPRDIEVELIDGEEEEDDEE
jgi:hypothetical protein